MEGADWLPFTLEHQQYVTLNTGLSQTLRMLRAQQCKFWDSFLPKLQYVTGESHRMRTAVHPHLINKENHDMLASACLSGSAWPAHVSSSSLSRTPVVQNWPASGA